jgi:hypothetical protein
LRSERLQYGEDVFSRSGSDTALKSMNYRLFVAVLAASLILAGCSAPGTGSGGSAPAPASARIASPSRLANVGSLRGYYLAKFKTVVGNALPETSFCFGFKPSGSWSNTGSEGFIGTYLLSRKGLYATALWLPSPAVYLSLQGSVNANQGSGTFIVSGGNGEISGGGTFTMSRKQNKSCT